MDSSDQKIRLKENYDKEIIGDKNENAEFPKKEREEMFPSLVINKNVPVEIDPKQKDKMKNLKFGGWLPDVLDWIKRTELAQSKLSISSYTFNRYCWPYLHGRKVKPHIIRDLVFTNRRDEDGNWQKILEKDDDISIPLADINPPDYIIGFERIFLFNIDDRVLKLMQAILPLLKGNVEIQYYQEFMDDPLVESLMEMLAPKINKLEICDSHSFNDLKIFNQKFPNFIFGLQSIFIYLSDNQINEFDLLMKWLTEARESGKPKMLQIYLLYLRYTTYRAIINQIVEEFSQALKPSNFVIRLQFFVKEEEDKMVVDTSDDEDEETNEDEEKDDDEDEDEDGETNEDEAKDDDEDGDEDGETNEDEAKDDDEDGDEETNEDEKKDDDEDEDEDEETNEDEKKDDDEDEDEDEETNEDEEKDDDEDEEEDEETNEDEKKDDDENEDEDEETNEDEKKDDDENEDDEDEDDEEERDEENIKKKEDEEGDEEKENEENEVKDEWWIEDEDEEIKMEDFEIENEKTGEMLKLDCRCPGDHFLIRYKKDAETEEPKVNWKDEFERKSDTTIWMLVSL